MAIYCNQRVVWSDTPHTSLFSGTMRTLNKCALTSWLKNVFVRITPHSWSSMSCVWLFVLFLFLALFLSVCLSYPLLFSSHFYLDTDVNLFLHVVDAKANVPFAFAE